MYDTNKLLELVPHNKDLNKQEAYFEKYNKYEMTFEKYNKLFEQDLLYIAYLRNVLKKEDYNKPMKYIISYYVGQTQFYKNILKHCENITILNNMLVNHINISSYTLNVLYYIDNNIFPLNEEFDRNILYHVINIEHLFKLYNLEFIEEKYNNKLTLEQHKYILDIVINKKHYDKYFMKYLTDYNYKYIMLYKYILRFKKEIINNNDINEINKHKAIEHIIKVIYSFINMLLEHNEYIMLHDYILTDDIYNLETDHLLSYCLNNLIHYYYSKLSKQFIKNNQFKLKSFIDNYKINEDEPIIISNLFKEVNINYNIKDFVNKYNIIINDSNITLNIIPNIVQNTVQNNNDQTDIQTQTDSINSQNNNLNTVQNNDEQNNNKQNNKNNIFKIDTANFYINLK